MDRPKIDIAFTVECQDILNPDKMDALIKTVNEILTALKNASNQSSEQD